MKQQEQIMVDWTELERLQNVMFEPAASETMRGEAKDEFERRLIEAFPAILSERREMLAKLEAAESDVARLHKEKMEYYEALMEFRNSTLTKKLEAAQKLRERVRHYMIVTGTPSAMLGEALVDFDKETA